MPRESVPHPHIGGLRQTRDQGLAELARRQQGIVSRAQLLDLGFSRRAIERRLEAARLHHLHDGVYAVGHRSIPKEGLWMAAVLSSGPDALLSHQTAAALWGLRGYSGGAIHVTVPRKSTSSKRIRRHFSYVPPDERTEKEGIPVTSVHRTIFDFAATASVDDVVAMIKEAEYLNLWDRLSLWDLLDRYPGKRGSRNLRFALKRITEEPPGRKRSKLEERFAPFLRRHHLPLPRFNDWIALGAKRYRADCHWPKRRLIVELDGWEGHSSRSAFQDDRARDRALKVAGYSVIHLTWAQLGCEPEAIAADLRALLQNNRTAPAGSHHPLPA
jgi:very-short-patch-repair endonuclease